MASVEPGPGHPPIIRESCAEIRAQLRKMAEEEDALRAEVARARREGWNDGYAAGMSDGAALATQKERLK